MLSLLLSRNTRALFGANLFIKGQIVLHKRFLKAGGL
jgi:hypothetical protein